MNGLSLSTMVDVSPKTLLGLQQRCIAAESLLFVQQAAHSLRPVLLRLLPKSAHLSVGHFYETVVDVLPLVRDMVYKALAYRLVPV